MPIKKETIGTTAVQVAVAINGMLCDILIQNLSANNVYVTSDISQGVGEGLKIVANGTYADDQCNEDLFLIADGAASDVRIKRLYYKGEKHP